MQIRLIGYLSFLNQIKMRYMIQGPFQLKCWSGHATESLINIILQKVIKVGLIKEYIYVKIHVVLTSKQQQKKVSWVHHKGKWLR